MHDRMIIRHTADRLTDVEIVDVFAELPVAETDKPDLVVTATDGSQLPSSAVTTDVILPFFSCVYVPFFGKVHSAVLTAGEHLVSHGDEEGVTLVLVGFMPVLRPGVDNTSVPFFGKVTLALVGLMLMLSRGGDNTNVPFVGKVTLAQFGLVLVVSCGGDDIPMPFFGKVTLAPVGLVLVVSHGGDDTDVPFFGKATVALVGLVFMVSCGGDDTSAPFFGKVTLAPVRLASMVCRASKD